MAFLPLGTTFINLEITLIFGSFDQFGLYDVLDLCGSGLSTKDKRARAVTLI
jgi:hypothetical protein